MDATTSGMIKDAVESLNSLKSLDRPFLYSSAFWTLGISSSIALLSSLIALLIAGGVGLYIKPLLGIKPNLELVNLKRFRQVTNYWRLSIKNSGNEIAKNVQIDVIKIIDEGKERENFLPIPLRWTHINCERRDILPGQIVHLDVIEHFSRKDESKIITRFGGGIENFERLKHGKTEIVLTLYEESTKPFERKVQVNWPAGMFFDAKIEGRKWHLTKNGDFFASNKLV